jgi:hypothetical protein
MVKSFDVLIGGGAKVGPGERLRGGSMGVDGLFVPPCASLRSEGIAARGERESNAKKGGTAWKLFDVGDVGADTAGVDRADEGSSIVVPEVSILRVRGCRERLLDEGVRERVVVASVPGEAGAERVEVVGRESGLLGLIFAGFGCFEGFGRALME